MAETQDSGAGDGNGANNKPRQGIGSLLQQYLDSLDGNQAHGGVSGSGVPPSTSPEGKEKLMMNYQGQARTSTGVVKIMRESGNEESAELLEELMRAQESARQLLDQLRDLHRRKTGMYPKLTKSAPRSNS